MRPGAPKGNHRQVRQRAGSASRPVEVIAPGPKLLEEGCKINFQLGCCEGHEFPPTFFEQGAKSRRVPARVVVEGRGDLNQAVEKNLFIAHGAEPHGFQSFVGFEEFPRVEKTNPCGDAIVHGL